MITSMVESKIIIRDLGDFCSFTEATASMDGFILRMFRVCERESTIETFDRTNFPYEPSLVPRNWECI